MRQAAGRIDTCAFLPALWSFCVLLAGSGIVHADVLCTISGYFRVESQDTYYCDTDYLECRRWTEIDLDAKRGPTASPLAFMAVQIQSDEGTLLKTVFTDENGYYIAFVGMPGSQCAGQTVGVVNWFKRVHEDDVAESAPRYRFRVANSNDVLWHHPRDVRLSDQRTWFSHTYPDRAASTSNVARVANVYYTVNSMVSVVVDWSRRINRLFIGTNAEGNIFRVSYARAVARTGWGTKSLSVSNDDWFEGFKIRHEMGHSIHNAMHQKNYLMAQPNNSCVNSNLLGHSGHAGTSCEWGSKAMKEAFASFLAIRSTTFNDTDVWSCSCNEDPNHGQDVCSELVAGLLADTDRFATGCTEGSLRGVGDRYSDSRVTCAQLDPNAGCDCASDPCEDAFRLVHGWQNSTQVMRFLWDMIDANDENGSDNTDESIQSLIAIIEGMPCTGNDWGQDGSCNEPNRKNARGDWACIPADPVTTIDPPHMATRHSYNVWDVAALIPGDQTAERRLNCVEGAED